MAALLCEVGGLAQSVSDFADLVSPNRFKLGYYEDADEYDAGDDGYDLSNFGVKAQADGIFFFKNNEYFANTVEGYTLVGYKIRPTVTVGTNTFSVSAGFQALRYGGLDDAHFVRPFLAANWQALGWLNLQMGFLPGPASHQLCEAITDPELELTEKPEFGAQIRVVRPHLDADVWLNWRQFIFKGDSIPERFSAGLKVNLHAGDTCTVGFRMPAGILFEHIGGQISDYRDTLQSLANISLEPTLVFRPTRRLHLSLGVNLLAFHAMAGSDVRPFADGWAIQPEVRVEAPHFMGGVGFFHGKDYYAMRGNPLFWSISNYDDTFYSDEREVLTIEASFVTSIGRWGRISLDFRGYHNVTDSNFDYSYGMTLVVSPRRGRIF